ncbi:MAG TPA: DNA primase [Dissulfurispiraceae bacterium]
MKSDHLIEEIKSRLDIVDLVAEHVDLKRAGQNYKGLCPFHSEKTPSFMVNPSKQIFHCFGCNKGGDIFAFVMEYESMTFQEALSHLADKAGLKVEDFSTGSKASKGLKEGLFAINKEASDFFTANLKNSEQARTYLRERGLADEMIETFSLGFSRGERDALLNHLRGKGFTQEHMKASGLVYFGDSAAGKGIHDFFRDRVMFPIFDMQGKIIAFGGRTMSAMKNIPKYLNSPDSILFKKGEACYGMNIAKNTISRKGYSIIVEGYLDSIMCHQYGFGNAVAPLGTALTSGHLKKLQRLSRKVLLLFDGDSAGMSAAKRSLELVYSEGMTAKVLMLPQGEDPDSFLRKHGAEQFRKHMGRALSPVEFILKIYGRGKLDAVRHMLSLIAVCPDPLQRDETLRELASCSGVSEQALRDELKNITRKVPTAKTPLDSGSGISPKKDQIKNEEEVLLNIALSMPEKAERILMGIEPEIIDNQMIDGIFRKMKTLLADDAGKKLSIEKLLRICDDAEQELVTKFSIITEGDQEYVDTAIEECLRKISLRNIEKQIKIAGQACDAKLVDSLTRMLTNILKREGGDN